MAMVLSTLIFLMLGIFAVLCFQQSLKPILAYAKPRLKSNWIALQADLPNIEAKTPVFNKARF